MYTPEQRIRRAMAADLRLALTTTRAYHIGGFHSVAGVAYQMDIITSKQYRELSEIALRLSKSDNGLPEYESFDLLARSGVDETL